MTNPYRAMCSELVTAVDLLCGSGDSPGQPGSRLILTVHVEALDELANRARALLAQPVAEGPTDEELLRVAASAIAPYKDCGIAVGQYEPEAEPAIQVYGSELIAYARAVLAHWGRPMPQPVWADIHYAWELHDAEGEWQAGGSAITLESVRREGNHYLQTYSQDGPHTLIIYRASTIEEVTND